MWAYYASSNQGYCIEYDLEKLEDKTKNPDFSVQVDVCYSDKIPILDLDDIRNKLIFQKMYGTKKERWHHEEELRLIFDNSSIKKYHESAITGIYFGCNSKDSLIEVFKEAFINRNIKFYKMVVNRENNSLESIIIYESLKDELTKINQYSFEILKYENNKTVENYFIYLKGKLDINIISDFVFLFRENYCYKPSNINIFDSLEIIDLLGTFSLKGKDYIRYADAYIASSYFDAQEVIDEYPFKDPFYQQQLREME